MKIRDILIEAPRNLIVLKSGQDFRVDPNPDHTTDVYKDAWTDDVAHAHVFKEKAARRFLLRREELARQKSMAHKQMKMVKVVLDDEGRAVLPEVRKPSMIDRIRRRKVA